jgi:hypothetical protein
MKKQILAFIFGMCVTILLAFRGADFTPSASTAEVNKIDGLFIFTDSKPVIPYDSLGSIEIGFVSDTQYESIRSSLIKKAKNKFPYADGILLNFNKKGVDHCVVIDLK